MKFICNFIIIPFLILGIYEKAYSQNQAIPSVSIDPQSTDIGVGKSFLFLEDDKNQIDQYKIKDFLLGKNTALQPKLAISTSLGRKNSTIWIIFKTELKDTKDTFSRRKDYILRLKHGSFSHAYAYLFDKQGNEIVENIPDAHLDKGLDNIFAKNLENHDYPESVYTTSIAPYKPLFTIYHHTEKITDANRDRFVILKLNSQFSIKADIGITNQYFLAQKINTETIIFSIYFSVIFALVMYVIILFIKVKKLLYLFYCIYLISFHIALQLSIIFIRFNYVYGLSTKMTGKVIIFAGSLLMITLTKLSVNFVSVEKNKLFYFEETLSKILVLVGILFGISNFFLSYNELIPIPQFLPFAAGAWGCYLSIRGLFRNVPGNISFFGSNFCLLSGATLYIMATEKIIPYNIIFENTMQIASVLDAILLAIAIADRIRSEHDEKLFLEREEKENRIFKVVARSLSHDVGNHLQSIALTADTRIQGILQHSEATQLNSKEDDKNINSLKKIKTIAYSLSKLADMFREQEITRHHRKSIQLQTINIDSLIETVTSNFEFKLKSKNLTVRIFFSNTKENCLTITEKIEKNIFSGVQSIELDGAGITKFYDENHDYPKFIHGEFKAVEFCIIGNTLSNAIKYSEAGSKIDIRLYFQSSTEVCVEMVDYGIGIPSQMLKTIFTEELEISRLGTHGESGTGFGMPILRESIQQIGGRVEIQSEENKGTQVIMIFNI